MQLEGGETFAHRLLALKDVFFGMFKAGENQDIGSKIVALSFII